jgi:hypothetical protein|tara:strand:+ start:245 stop:388 length:144 start_codon:yes stop_codon:yes gene_type:complete
MSYSVDEIYDTVFDNIEYDKDKEEKIEFLEELINDLKMYLKEIKEDE